jgi:hypothetical protein
MIGNNWHRKRWLQPTAYAFLDVSGTRHNAPIVGKNVVPGVHAIWCVPRRMTERFDDLCPYRINLIAWDNFRARRNVQISKVTHSPDQVISYSPKFLKWEVGDVADDQLWTIFPKATSESTCGPESVLA